MKRFLLAATALIGLIVGASAAPNPLVELAAFAPFQTFAPAAAPSGSTPFTALHTYFMGPAGNDSTCDGTVNVDPPGVSGHCRWATPNHSAACGDVIIAAAGSYSSSGLGTFGSVSGCPSSSAGINGVGGGIYFAVLLCGSTLGACDVNYTSTGWGAQVTTNNWAVEGFQIHGFSGGGYSGFVADGSAAVIHHVAFVNNVAYNVGFGFGAQAGGALHDVPGTTGFDYVAFIGNIAQNAAQNGTCSAAMVMVAPSTIDSNTGTHFLMDGNFAYNQTSPACNAGVNSDVENYMYDSPDVHGVTNQFVAMNNVGWSAYRFGFQYFVQNFNNIAGGKGYVLNNTMFNNMTNNGGGGDINIQMNNAGAINLTVQDNLTLATLTNECGMLVGGDPAFAPTSLASITTGGTGHENINYNSATPANSQCPFNGYTFGTNTQANPTFNSTANLLSSWTGAPNCAGFENTAQCMGYDAYTSTLTTNTPIYDLTPTGTYSAKGYQKPSITCASSGIVNTYFPSWLKGIVYLHWNGAGLEQKHGLVTTPCGF